MGVRVMNLKKTKGLHFINDIGYITASTLTKDAFFNIHLFLQPSAEIALKVTKDSETSINGHTTASELLQELSSEYIEPLYWNHELAQAKKLLAVAINYIWLQLCMPYNTSEA